MSKKKKEILFLKTQIKYTSFWIVDLKNWKKQPQIPTFNPLFAASCSAEGEHLAGGVATIQEVRDFFSSLASAVTDCWTNLPWHESFERNEAFWPHKVKKSKPKPSRRRVSPCRRHTLLDSLSLSLSVWYEIMKEKKNWRHQQHCALSFQEAHMACRIDQIDSRSTSEAAVRWVAPRSQRFSSHKLWRVRLCIVVASCAVYFNSDACSKQSANNSVGFFSVWGLIVIYWMINRFNLI